MPSVHALINALSVYIIILWMFSLWWIILAVFITHFLIDYAKTHWTSDNAKWFLADQAAHLCVLGAIWTENDALHWDLDALFCDFRGVLGFF